MIYKIQECEAQLATAQDKGEQIASEGSVADRNTIAEQLTSLKHQLSSLRRAVEQRRGEHENAGKGNENSINEQSVAYTNQLKSENKLQL